MLFVKGFNDVLAGRSPVLVRVRLSVTSDVVERIVDIITTLELPKSILGLPAGTLVGRSI